MVPVLVDDRPAMRKLLRAILVDEGYPVIEVLEGQRTLECLRTCSEPLVALVSGTTLRAGTGFVQAAAVEPAVGRHALVVLTATPEALAPWRVLLDTLGAPVVAKPFVIDALLQVVAEAAQRLTSRVTESLGSPRATAQL